MPARVNWGGHDGQSIQVETNSFKIISFPNKPYCTHAFNSNTYRDHDENFEFEQVRTPEQMAWGLWHDREFRRSQFRWPRFGSMSLTGRNFPFVIHFLDSNNLLVTCDRDEISNEQATLWHMTFELKAWVQYYQYQCVFPLHKRPLDATGLLAATCSSYVGYGIITD
jgi:hypothetical protein